MVLPQFRLLIGHYCDEKAQFERSRRKQESQVLNQGAIVGLTHYMSYVDAATAKGRKWKTRKLGRQAMAKFPPWLMAREERDSRSVRIRNLGWGKHMLSSGRMTNQQNSERFFLLVHPSQESGGPRVLGVGGKQRFARVRRALEACKPSARSLIQAGKSHPPLPRLESALREVTRERNVEAR